MLKDEIREKIVCIKRYSSTKSQLNLLKVNFESKIFTKDSLEFLVDSILLEFSGKFKVNVLNCDDCFAVKIEEEKKEEKKGETYIKLV